MKAKSVIVLLGVSAVIAAYATGAAEFIPAWQSQTLKLSQTGGDYKVSGIGKSVRTTAAIINHRVVTKGEFIKDNLMLEDVSMDPVSLSAENIRVTVQ